MKNLIFVKLGGSLITDKRRQYTARMDVIKRLVKEIHQARRKKEIKLIIGHGGGSFPHVSASKYQTQRGIINRQSYRGMAVVQNDAARLNRIIVDALLKAGENAISVQPSSAAIARNGRIVDWHTKPIEKMLSYDLVPVPYGDVGIDLKKGCCILSTEEVFNYLAKRMKPKKIIVVGNVDGVFDSSGRLIQKITKANFRSVKKYLAGSGGIDVTGGMLHKVEEMLELTKSGIKSEIINGERKELLLNALIGKKVRGTRIA